MSATAPLAEVFASFQGEGTLTGVCQLFVRTRGCDLACLYCDTPAAREVVGPCRIEREPGTGRWEHADNPFSAERLVCELLPAYAGLRLHSMALTGGEPLLHPEFVTELGRLCVERGLPLYLETGGHRPAELARVLEAVSFVSLDYKLPATLGAPVDQALFVESYAVAAERLCAVKMVVTADVTLEELEVACRALAEVSAAGPLVLQPVTRLAGGPAPPSAAHLHALYREAARWMRAVRVIPQCHRLVGVL